MANNYKNIRYFETRPDIVQIFDDLEGFLDWCKIEGAPFDESDLYNRESWQWRNFEKSRRPKKAYTGERKPYLGKNPKHERFEN